MVVAVMIALWVVVCVAISVLCRATALADRELYGEPMGSAPGVPEEESLERDVFAALLPPVDPTLPV